MKSIGIVRRIDDLGRVVIPKEIRRTLRIREGDPLEIYVQGDTILLKKYSPVAELGDFAQEYAESLSETLGHIVLIADRDIVITISGGNKRDFLGKPVGSYLENIMYWEEGEEVTGTLIKNGETYPAQFALPINVQGDIIGTIAIISKDPAVKFGETDIKPVECAASFLAKQLEQ